MWYILYMKPIPPSQSKSVIYDQVILISFLVNLAPLLMLITLNEDYFLGLYLILGGLFAIIYDIVIFFSFKKHPHKKILYTIIFIGFFVYTNLFLYFTQ